MGATGVLSDSEKIPYWTNDNNYTKHGIFRIIIQTDKKFDSHRWRKIPIL